MPSINEILEEILREIIPTEKELDLISGIVKNLKSLLAKKAMELKLEYTHIEPQGSTGIKQTQLRNDFDIDLFIGLKYDLYKSKFKGLSKNKLKKESKKDFLKLCNDWIIKSLDLKEFQNPRLLYAEHPYVTVDYLAQNVKIKLDIVLFFDLPLEYIEKNGPITSVDRSPWHGRFIRDNLSKEQKNHVRLLKHFFKACHCYGDKSAVGKVGFFGYIAELLIYHFETIQNLFENFSTLRDKPIDFFNRSEKELEKITHFQNDHLIITDPIDMNRNVGSAVAESAYKYCNNQIEHFLKYPTREFFQIKPIPEADLSDLNDSLLSNIYIIESRAIDNEKHYTLNRDKLHALGETIKANGEKEPSHVERFGHIVYDVYFEDGKKEYNLAVYCENPEISPTYLRRGPPNNETKHVAKFKEKNPYSFEKDGYLWVESKRTDTSFIIFLSKMIKDKIPENLEVNNISNSFKVKTTSGKKAITVLKDMVLPYYL